MKLNILGNYKDWISNYLKYTFDNIIKTDKNRYENNYESYKKRFFSNYYMEQFYLDLSEIRVASRKVVDTMNMNRKILLVTDYDADGLTSAVVLTKFFRDIVKYKNTETVVNTRQDGNGFNKTLVNRILEIDANDKVSLIITADHGSSNNKEIGSLRSAGIETIITDHHVIPKNNYPEYAYALINAMKDDDKCYNLASGCYTAFMLCMGIYKEMNKDLKDMYPLLPYVAISTIVDQMPMDHTHNRSLTKLGIKIYNDRRDINLIELNRTLELPPLINYRNIGWNIGPFINSGNRCNTEQIVFNGLVENDKDKIIKDLSYAININNERKNDQKEIYDKIEDDIVNIYPNIENVFGLVLVIDTNYGIAGPIASRVGDNYHKPTIVFRSSIKSGILSGSGRAIIDVNILEVLKEIQYKHPDVIKTAAGHSGACGIEIYSNKLNTFRELFSNGIKEVLNGELPVKEPIIAAYVDPKDIHLGLALEVEHMGPYGNSYPEPKFTTKMKYKSSFNMGSNKLCTFYRNKNVTIEAMYFFTDDYLNNDNWNDYLIPDQEYELVFTVSIGYYRNSYSLSMVIENIIKH